jgi:protein-disulfide isomerase-like protein with CxxC motif
VRERIEHEVAAVVLKEFALQDAGMLGGTKRPWSTTSSTSIPVNDQEILRHLHQVAVDWVDHYKREQNPVGASS